MIDIFLVSYKVQGIKNLDSMVSLSFYKKTIRKPIDTQDYNIKGIYGMNGSGKSAIIISINILKNLIIDKDYLYNGIVQEYLNEIINKKSNKLYIEAEFLVEIHENEPLLYNYLVELRKDKGKYSIYKEKLSYKNATSKKEKYYTLIEVSKCEINIFSSNVKDKFIDNFKITFEEKTKNLLEKSTASSLFLSEIILSDKYEKIMEKNVCLPFISLFKLILFGKRIFVYIEETDNYTNIFLRYNIIDSLNNQYNQKYIDTEIKNIIENKFELNIIDPYKNSVEKEHYHSFEERVGRLQDFIQIFKPELKKIDIDRKENVDFYECYLNMVYDDYSINTVYESTGIKKLIKLFAYLQAMVQGGIVFIDEFDSNLHDVYLCALIEYLMEYGKGQLCFTTHNVGPMDKLENNKKSIDFLSINHSIYPWKKNGKYSSSQLYKEGMIEGSPFNVNFFDFIGIFNLLEEGD